jgi:hypothetical protein
MNAQPASKFLYSRFRRILFSGAILSFTVLLLTACTSIDLPALGAIPTVTATSLPAATLAPTATRDPFEGLKICRTWQEAVNCPITERDFRRISDYVKANYKFAPEAMKVSFVEAVPVFDRTSFILIHAMFKDKPTPGFAETSGVKGRKYVYDNPWSPIGEPFFFNLKKNPPENNYDNLIAVFPVNNADGSLGTYTTITAPCITSDGYKSPEKCTEGRFVRKYEEIPYLPVAFNIGQIPISNYEPSKHGTLIEEVVRGTNDPKGKRKEMIDKWVKTAIIPKELEELPLFGSDFTPNGMFQDKGR